MVKFETTKNEAREVNKEWYKNWWGVLVAIIFLPFFIIWYVWAKSKLGNTWKIAITIIIGILFVCAMRSGDSSPTKTASNTSTPATPSATAPAASTPAATSQPTTTPAPSYSFDIPSLMGKNIDQIREAIGQPIQVTNKGALSSTDSATLEPTSSDLDSTGNRDPWSNSWTKDNYEIMVAYNYKTRAVELINLSLKDESPVANEQVLLTVGNLNANGGTNYKVTTTTCGSLVLGSDKCNSSGSDAIVDVQAVSK